MVPRQEKGTHMSKTASIGLLPSSTLFGRLMASIDRLLTASAASPFATATSPISASEPENTGLPRPRRDRTATTSLRRPDKWPRLPGPFRVLQSISALTAICDKLAGATIGKHYTVASWHIAYKDAAAERSADNKSVFGRGGRAVQKDSQRDRGERAGGFRVHCLGCFPTILPTIGRKERMPPRKAPPTIRTCNHRMDGTIAA